MITKKIIPVLLFAVLFTHASYAQWNIPAGAKNKKPSITYSNSTANAGKAIYEVQCVDCHGDMDKSMSSEFCNNSTDGEMFYKIRNGSEDMPAYEGEISDNDIWKVISYIKSFIVNFTSAEVEEVAEETAEKVVEKLKIDSIIFGINHDEENFKIIIHLIGIVKDKVISLAGTEVSIYTERMFGTLQLGKTKETDSSGYVIIDLPKDLPGDERGNIDINIKAKNEDISVDSEHNIKISTGVLFYDEDILGGRQIWSAHRPPYWLLISFIGLLISVWICVAYIVFNLIRISSIGKKHQSR